jgi:hypothetical protein
MRLVGALCLAILLAGCGSTSGSSLEDAADATAAETSRFEMSYLFSRGGGKEEGELTAAGVFDYPNERGIMTVSGSAGLLAADVSFEEFRLLGQTGYARWVVKGKSYWVKEDDVETSGDPTELLIPFPGSPTKPTDVLTRVLLASEENMELGKEAVRETETTHYRARVDLQKLVKQLPESERPEGDIGQLWGARFVPVEIWIDDESRLRRIEFTQGDEDESSVKTTVDLFDYGVEFDVEPPPADELISEADFDKLTGSSMELEVGEGEAVSPEEVCATAREDRKDKADRFCLGPPERPESMENP